MATEEGSNFLEMVRISFVKVKEQVKEQVKELVVKEQVL